MNNDSNILSHFFNVVKMIKKKMAHFLIFFQEENVSAAVRVAHNDINV